MTGFRPFLIRDSILLVITLASWALLLPLSPDALWASDTLAVLLGFLAGACAWQAHEWGHLLFAKACGARLHAPDNVFSVYLFGFRNAENTKLQFLLMAVGGFIATALVFLVLIPLLPQEALATRIFRSLVIIEIIVTTLLEVPGLMWGIFSYKTLPSVNVLPETPAE